MTWLYFCKLHIPYIPLISFSWQGRLASYKYFNMDQAILNALELFDKLVEEKKIPWTEVCLRRTLYPHIVWAYRCEMTSQFTMSVCLSVRSLVRYVCLPVRYNMSKLAELMSLLGAFFPLHLSFFKKIFFFCIDFCWCATFNEKRRRRRRRALREQTVTLDDRTPRRIDWRTDKVICMGYSAPEKTSQA